MKKIIKLGLLAVLAAGTAFSAQALSITPSSGTLNVTRWEGDQTSQAQIDIAIAAYIGSAIEVYKQDVGAGSDSGSLAGSYTTTFSASPTDPSAALIDYIGGAYVSGTAYLLIKDGNQTPAWYLYNLTALGWNGTDDLSLSGFWPDQGAISHVALYGQGGTTVPDGGTSVALLGMAVGLVGLVRRKIGA